MNNKGPFDPRKEAHLLSAFVDGELDSLDEERVQAHLQDNEAARHEVEQLRRLKHMTGQLRLKEPPPEIWEAFWDSVYHRVERSLGWILLAAGVIILGSWAMVRLVTFLVTTAAIPMIGKAGLFVLAAGSLTLLLSVIRERVFKRSRTRYKDVQR